MVSFPNAASASVFPSSFPYLKPIASVTAPKKCPKDDSTVEYDNRFNSLFSKILTVDVIPSPLPSAVNIAAFSYGDIKKPLAA